MVGNRTTFKSIKDYPVILFLLFSIFNENSPVFLKNSVAI